MMKTSTKTLIIALLSATCINLACSDESLESNPPDQPTISDPSDTPVTPDKPTPDDPQPTPEKCRDQCEKNALQCNDSAVMICQKGDDGCLDWFEKESCETGMHCDDATKACAPGCAETCSKEAQMRCNEENVEKCTSDENGCAVWELVDECDTSCNPETFSCVEQCTSNCEAGAKKCTDNGIAECVDSDGDGCFDWADPVPCANNQRCDDSTITCTNTCTSQCKEGEIEAFATSSKKCMDSNGDGCFEWVNDKTCKKGEKYDKATDSCVLACGNDCTPFSIVLLPDTQYYTRTYADASKSAPKLRAQIDWIKKNQTDRNIKAVINLGDMTDTNHPNSYKYNTEIFGLLDKNLPWLPSGGNHDYLNGKCNDGGNSNCPYSKLRSDGYTFNRSASKYSTYINNDTFKGKSWFGGFHGVDAYIKFRAANTDFIAISLEYAPRKTSLCWAEKIIQDNPNAKIILETHSYLSNTAHKSTRDKNKKYTAGRSGGVQNNEKYNISFFNAGSGTELFNEIASRYNNVILVASGHTNGSVFRMGKADGGNWLAEVLVDYQSENTGNNNCTDSFSAASKHGSGGGWLRVLTFDPKKLTVTSETISATGEKKFICSQYPSSPTQTPGFTLDPEDDAKAATNAHKFVANYDFITPVDFKYTDNKTGYQARTVNAISAGNQETPAVAMNRTTGDHIIVWADDAYDSNKNDTDGAGNMNIIGRVFCKTGCDLGKTQFTINTTTAGNQNNPDVAMDKAGNFVAVWTNVSDKSVYMRKFDINGKELIKETKVNTSGNADNSAVAMDDAGNFVVTWQNGSDIVMRGFDAKGQQTFAQTPVSTQALSASGFRKLPDIAMDKAGNFVIAWEDDAKAAKSSDIKARGFDKKGTERIPEFTANKDKTNEQKNPAIGMNREGVFHIAWEDDNDGNGTYRIRMSAWNADGTALIADQLAGSSQAAHDPDVCVASDGTGYFTWAAEKFKDDSNSYTNAILRASSKDFATQKIASKATQGVQDQPATACTDSGKFVIAWHDDVDGNKAYEVMSRGFN